MVSDEVTLRPEEVHGLIERVLGVCATFQIESLRPQINAILGVVRDVDTLDVAVLGRFKAGKSSFLNTIVGRDVMPIGVLPITAIVTRIRHGTRERAVAQLLDGRLEEIPLARLPEYITEQHNPANAKHVAIVEVELPGLHRYPNLRFVDTPGLGSVFIHNTQTAMDWLLRVGVSMLAIGADHPLSEDDLQLLRDLLRQSPEVVILVTKADLVTREELGTIVQFIRQQVERSLGKSVAVLPFSVRAGFQDLRDVVSEFLAEAQGRFGQELRSVVTHKLCTLVEDSLGYLRMALAAAAAAEESRRSLRSLLARERLGLDRVRHEIAVLIRDLKSRSQAEIYDRFERQGHDLSRQLLADFHTATHSWKGNLKETVEEFRRWATSALTERLEPLSVSQGLSSARETLHQAQDTLSRVVRAFQDRLVTQIKETLQTSFAGADFVANIAAPSRPDISVGQVFDTHLDSLWFLFPMGIFRPLVRRHFGRVLCWEVEKNLSRLGSQWLTAIYLRLDDLATQAGAFILNELNAVESLVTEARDRSQEIAAAINDLERAQVEMTQATLVKV